MVTLTIQMLKLEQPALQLARHEHILPEDVSSLQPWPSEGCCEEVWSHHSASISCSPCAEACQGYLSQPLLTFLYLACSRATSAEMGAPRATLLLPFHMQGKGG